MSLRSLGLSSLAGLRRPLAAAAAVGGMTLGSVVAVAAPAAAAEEELSATAEFVCQTGTFPEFDWEATFTITAARVTDDSTSVLVTASVSDMAGVVPVTQKNQTVTDTLVLDIGGTEVTLTGTGTVDIPASKPFPVPELQGTMTTDATEGAVTVTSFNLDLAAFPTLGTKCAPASGADLGEVAIVTDPDAVPTPTPTTTVSATATPTASESTSPSGKPSSGSKGEPAKGKAAFACVMNIGSEFDYDPTITVSGFRENAGDPVSLVASLTNLPGLSPVPIDGTMEYTLDAEVGGEKVTLTSSANVTAAANADVAVADLTGEVDVEGDELEVAVTGFSFDFPSGGVGAECTADRTVLGTMTVGSEPIDGGPGDNGTTPPGSAGGDLPKTGGGDSTPVVLLWAGAFALLGAGVLLAVPGRSRRLREH